MTYAFIIQLPDGPTNRYAEVSEIQEQDVLDCLLKFKKLRIGQLVSEHNDMGSHKVYEYPRKETTVRKMYQLIRNLRELGCPIVGD